MRVDERRKAFIPDQVGAAGVPELGPGAPSVSFRDAQAMAAQPCCGVERAVAVWFPADFERSVRCYGCASCLNIRRNVGQAQFAARAARAAAVLAFAIVPQPDGRKTALMPVGERDGHATLFNLRRGERLPLMTR